ncbi:InlB B-repeat-containing protein [Alkalimonas sp.]|uniref:InlB B-repeat-containing protein n=1 Tax=Alkalimonas sp. TaxID=1872453 RepID=UPI00263B609E|nr:InlB B-repeat-containing protein [Alkalimonas sp.]MCC5825396.1 InlB B-repeat-containing protein [Alkalimonas sp.]
MWSLLFSPIRTCSKHLFSLLILSYALLISTAASATDCTITSTVAQISDITQSNFDNEAIGQSFTACKDGRIKELRLLSFLDGTIYQGADRNELTITLYQGDGLAGTELGTFTFSTNLLHEHSALDDYSIIPMSDGNFVLSSGELYTFYFAGGGVNTFFGIFNHGGVAAPYAGGQFYLDGDNFPDRDLMFQLVMEDAPVANDPPTDILLTSNSVNQSAGVNAVVGSLSSVDPDDGDTHTYSLVAGAGDTNNGSFNISGNQLRANNASSLAAGNYSVRIRTTDSATNTFEKAFTLTVLDDVPPIVNSVSVPPYDIYSAGNTLDFTINASEALTVNTAGGTPRIALDIGGTTRYASYISGSGTTAVVFRYVVQAGDNDLDGIEVGILELDGGTIRDSAGNDLNLTLNSVTDTSGVLVDTSPPSITAIANQTVVVGQSTAALGFTIGDNLTTAASLSVNRASSNTIAVPLADVVLGGSGANRTITITGGDTGTSTITITVMDAAGNSAQQAFQVEVTPPSYTVSFVDWDATVLKTETVNHGSGATAPANPSRTGYSFTGWSPSDFSNITADTTITAQYSINSYTLTFDSAGGSAVASITQAFGSAITPPANPSRTGHNFAGWSPSIPASMPAENLTLTAQWTAHNYAIHFIDWNGIVLKSQTIAHGNSATPPDDPSRTGHTFTGWSPSDFSNITANTIFTAQFSINSYTLTFDTAGGSAIAAFTQTYGSTITPPADPSRDGHTFTGWNPTIPATMPAENRTLTAQWAADTYTVSFVDWDGTLLKTETVNHGSGATAPSNPSRIGYSFTGWNPSNFSNITADTTVTAQYSISSYSVNFVDWDNTVIKTETVTHGNGATAPPVPSRTGYSFTGWSPADFNTIIANTTVTAQYNVNSFTLTFDSAEGSAVEPITANFGTTINPPEPPIREGFAFTGWQPELPITMPSEDKTFTAQWTRNRFTVSTSLSGDGSVTPASQQIVLGNSASFELSVAEDKFVQIDSNCAASRSGNEIVTAAIKADCSISLTVHTAMTLEVEDSSPAASQETRRFRLSNGAGEQVLSALQQTRSGTTEWLDLADAGILLTLQDDGSYLFNAERTGRYSFEFTDSVSGEQLMVSFDVLPFIAFTAASQPVQQDIPAQLRIWLSDEPIDYPVQVQVQASQAQVISSFELNAMDNLRRAYSVTAIAGNTASITLLNDGLEQALLGSPHSHQLLVQTEPPPLSLQAAVIQDGIESLVVQRSGGIVELSATELSGIAAEFNWHGMGLAITQSGASAHFDPAGLPTDRHYLQLSAEAGERKGELELALNVIAECPVADCSNSGVSGIPASQNQYSSHPNRLPLCPQENGNSRVAQCQNQAALFVEVPALYQLTLGLYSELASWQSGQFGLALSESSIHDIGYRQLGFMVNFDVIGLQSPGESVPIAIPMPAGQSIPANAVWRKLVNGLWQDFVEDETNRIDSAPRNALGNCPVVSSDSWRAGLNEGDACIRLTIEDGGPNDDDGRANSVIRDPGVLAQQQVARISFASAGGSEIADITALVGSTLTAPEPPWREGYTFTGWQPAFPATMPEHDVQLTAQWQINQYVIRFDVNGGEAIPDLVLDYGATINAPTATRSGYTFSGWSPALPTTMPAQDLQVTAQWQPSSVTVTSSGGSLSLLSVILLTTLLLMRRCHSSFRHGKGSLKVFIASLLLLPMVALSQDWYIGVQGGEARSHSSGNLASAAERKLHAAGVSGTVRLHSNSDTAYRLFAGYRLNHWLAAEFGWLDLGEAVLHYDGLPPNQPYATIKAQPQRGRGAELSLVGHFALDGHWQPFARLALFDNRSRYQFEGPAAQAPKRHSRIRLGAELGMGYQLSPQLQLSAAAAHYDTENFNTQMLSLGLRYSF